MKSYPAKLLLFGEHTVNLGSKALAIPLFQFSGKWQFASNLSASALANRQMRLPDFAGYLENLQAKGELLCSIDLASFREALAAGLFFESDIPKGYGAGSSGALTAAVFDSFSLKKDQWNSALPLLKKVLAQMESFFHGTSSGTDPLICYLQKPILLSGKSSVEICQLPTVGCHLFLLDTGIERQATPMIEYFLEKNREENFNHLCREQLLPAVEGAIEAFLQGNEMPLFACIHTISKFQFRFLEKMIPPAFHAIWQQGLESRWFKLKICGAGGGGFLLGITSDFEEAKKAFAEYKILPVSFENY